MAAIRRGLVRGGGLGGGLRDDTMLGPQPPTDIDTRVGLGGAPPPEPGGNGPAGKIGDVNSLNAHAGQFSESPRERETAQAVPRQPMQPSPAGGAPSAASTGQGPFMPLPSLSPASMATPGLGGAPGGFSAQKRNLFGGHGGLTGGGLGVPLDPQSNDASDPISSLIQLLLKGQGGM